MKKRFSMIAAVAGALLVGVTSCNKQADELQGEGSLKISFNFDSGEGDNGGSKAPVSAALPTTDWSNVESLQLVLANPGTGNVEFAQFLTPPSVAGPATEVINQIPAGTYDIYLIANNGAAGNPMDPNAGSSGTAKAFNKGVNINTELVKLATETAPEGVTETDIYKAPSELFVGKVANQVIAGGDATTSVGPVSLTRIVGLMRILINQKDPVAQQVNFKHEKAYVRIRRHAIGWSYGTNLPTWASPKSKATVLAKRAFSDQATGVPGYSNGAMLTGDFTNWMDVMCLPGGSASVGADKLNIVIYGWAPKDYEMANGNKITDTNGGLVYWEGAVNAELTANNILEIQATIKSAGNDGGGSTPPDVSDFGNLSISFSVSPWGTISETELPL